QSCRLWLSGFGRWARTSAAPHRQHRRERERTDGAPKNEAEYEHSAGSARDCLGFLDGLLRLGYARAILEPLKVCRWRVGCRSAHASLDRWTHGVSHHPFVWFRMAIRKGKVGAPVVIGGRKIPPLIIIQTVHEKTVVDRVRMLIQKHKDVRRVRNRHEGEELH